MRRRSAVALQTLLAGGLTACSFVFDLPEGAGLIPSPDSGVVGGTFDAGPLADGGAPKTVVPFCASRTDSPVFCADFDGDPAPALDGIGAARVTPGAIAQLVTSVALSPSRATLVTASAPGASAAVVHPLGATPNGITYSFDMLVSAWGTSDADIMPIELVDGATRCVIRLRGQSAKWLLVLACGAAGVENQSVTSDTQRPIERARWQRFSLSIKFAPAKQITLDIDGVRVVDLAALDPMTGAAPAVYLGIETLRSGNVALFEDNALVTSP